jgi:hypothetical protein
MVSQALPILGSRGRAQGPEWDLALLAGVTGLLYVDQRIRRERFDLQLATWAAEAERYPR